MRKQTLPWDHIVHQNYYSSGREGLLHLIQHREQRAQQLRVLLPAYAPEGIVDPFIKSDWDIKFYKVDDELQPDIPHIRNLIRGYDYDMCVAIHFFHTRARLDELKLITDENSILLIEDFSHSITNSFILVGDIGLGSLTKTLDLADGALLISRTPQHLPNLNKSNRSNWLFLIATHTCFLMASISFNGFKVTRVLNTLFQVFFKPYDRLMEKYHEINKISIISKYLLPRQNFEKISKQQQNNNKIYQTILHNYTVPTEYVQSVDFGFMILTPHRNRLREALAKLDVETTVLTNRWDYRFMMDEHSVIESAKYILDNHIILPNRDIGSHTVTKLAHQILQILKNME